MRVNLGCGSAYLDGWVNVDEYPDVKADVYASAFDFVRDHGADVDELFMGHMLEHLVPASGLALLRSMVEHLPEGAVVSAVTPDMSAIFDAYRAGEITNVELNERFVYSYEQPSRHVWCYDAGSLRQLFEEAGFVDVEELDPLTWEPVWWKEGPESRWQCGVEGRVPAVAEPADEPSMVQPHAPRRQKGALPPTAEDALLGRIRSLKEALAAVEAEQAEQAEAVARVRDVEHAMRSYKEQLDAIERSRSYRLARKATGLARRLLPPGSKARHVARFAVDAAREARSTAAELREKAAKEGLVDPKPLTYPAFLKVHGPSAADLERQTAIAHGATDPVDVRVVVLDRGGDLRPTLRSIKHQSWPVARVLVLSSDPDAVGAVAELDDDRFLRWDGDDETFAERANSFVSEGSLRDFVVFVEAGDRVAQDAVFWVAEQALEDPLVDLVTFDDDVLDAEGRRTDPRFHPAWSPDQVLGANTHGRAFAIRGRRYVAADGLQGTLTDASWWGLLLRSGLPPLQVARVPRVLLSQGRRPSPTPDGGAALVTAELARRGWPAAAEAVADGRVRVRWDLDDAPSVTIVIATRHNEPMLDRCLPTLAATGYPGRFEVVIVDNGDRTPEAEAYYERWSDRLDLRVEWWTKTPFNYPEVYNHGTALGSGEVVVQLNDDTELHDPDWLTELVGWATHDEIGSVGALLVDGAGAVQHAGIVIGIGYADHPWAGMAPDAETIFGRPDQYRNTLAVTGACVAMRRSQYERHGGHDERFRLCGSDVALGIDAHLDGLRNVVTPYTGIAHLESATRGTTVPAEDFYTSYWRYTRWANAGDPFWSPNLSLSTTTPSLRNPIERTAPEMLAGPIGRPHSVFRQRNDEQENRNLADLFRGSRADARAVAGLHAANAEPFDVRTITWFLPDIDSPFYGGINTALRIADHLAANHGVRNQFAFWSSPNEAYMRSAITAAFPRLADSVIEFHDTTAPSLERLAPCDVAIATQWVTAYSVVQFPHARRKAYLIQDFEPAFYPAGTLYALTEQSYEFGLYGICNTKNLLDRYQAGYGGRGTHFMPATDPAVFHPGDRAGWDLDTSRPVTCFVYARPGHWRNCWELASLALEEAKDHLGDRLRIVTAGSWARPEDLGTGIKHLGLLDYRETGNLYRRCDFGVALTVSAHPSYLPLELMSCGASVVAYDNPAGYWLMEHERNALLTPRTVDGLRNAIVRMATDSGLRHELQRNALKTIADGHSDWSANLSGIYGYLCDPEGRTPAPAPAPAPAPR